MQLAYKAIANRDNDPVTESELGGETASYELADDAPPPDMPFPLGGLGSLIYLETYRDADIEKGRAGRPLEWNASTTPHEIGHQMGLRGDDSNMGVMSSSDATFNFIPRHLNMLRTRVNSPEQ